jgi:hypothetical protein
MILNTLEMALMNNPLRAAVQRGYEGSVRFKVYSVRLSAEEEAEVLGVAAAVPAVVAPTHVFGSPTVEERRSPRSIRCAHG